MGDLARAYFSCEIKQDLNANDYMHSIQSFPGHSAIQYLKFSTFMILFTLITTSTHSMVSAGASFKTCSSTSSKHSKIVSIWDT